jgi:hypothetical protein
VYQSFRNAYPGEGGPRNIFRYPGYIDLDLGLGKSFKMPWNEGHQLQIRWDVFNVTNTQRLTGIADFAVAQDPGLNQLRAAGLVELHPDSGPTASNADRRTLHVLTVTMAIRGGKFPPHLFGA